MKYTTLSLLVFFSLSSFAQIDSSFIQKLKALDTANNLKVDTITPPNDALTQKIKALRKEKSGLTTESLMKLKLMDEQPKDTAHSKEYYNRLLHEMAAGRSSMLLENIMINLYRRYFTEDEVVELIRFYKTSAGKKTEKEFFLLMVQSVKDAEQLLKIASTQISNELKKEGKAK